MPATESAPEEAAAISRRHVRLRESLAEHDLHALAVNAGPSLSYLTGLNFHISERPVVLFMTASARPTLVLPELEIQKAKSAPVELDLFTYGEGLETWGTAFQAAAEHAGIDNNAVGVEPGCMRVLELRFLESAAPGARYISGEACMAALRMLKDDEELSQMQRATEIAEIGLQNTLPFVEEGVTEKEIAGRLIANMLQLGSEGELPFQPIIAFGANSANPHAVPTDYALRRGDLVLFDWGANSNGYFSDLTRMFSLGEPDDELRRIVEIVGQANEAGRSAVAPGTTAGSIDDATRSVIKEAGYAERFVHRTGHGLGLEVHEPPYIRADNTRALEVGMTFTIEPGIYLPGRGGARIEDDMVVTPSGGRSLSSISRQLGIL